MNFLFFQNCISPHQMPYIEALSALPGVTRVVVFAPRVTYDDRARMGWPSAWTVGDCAKLSVEIAPSESSVRQCLAAGGASGEPVICLFSGLRADAQVFCWFKLSLRYDVKRGLITEAPFTYRIPLWAHKFRFALQDRRFVPYIDYVFAIGRSCADYYRLWSRRWLVVPFQYCTASLSEDLRVQVCDYMKRTDPADPMHILFVGSLDRRKNVHRLLYAVSRCSAACQANLSLTLVGAGPERDRLEALVTQLGIKAPVRFCGALLMSQVQTEMAQHDLLVLPSVYDGWGAVINEALTLGLWPACSNRCGATQLFDAMSFEFPPATFDPFKVSSLTAVLERACADRSKIRAERCARMSWATEYISQKYVAQQMFKSIYSNIVKNLSK